MFGKKIDFSKILTVVILLFGGFLRLYPLFKMDFLHEPFRLGGLFVAFSEEIIHNGFALPVTIPYYSTDGIPFGYPPLGFYVEAILLKVFPTQQLAIANILPACVAMLTLLLVWWLLRKIFPADEKYVLAGLFGYAFLANAFSNQIEAGGLSESFGSLAMLLYFASLWHYRRGPNRIRAVLAGLALGLCVLSSPGSAIAATALSILLALEVLVRQKEKMAALLQIGLMTFTGALVSAPYWLTVILYHGRGFFILPVLAQYQNGGKIPYTLSLFNRLTSFDVSNDAGAFFWNMLIFLGLLWLFFRGKPVIPLVFLTLFSIPRENFWLMAFPATLLFAHGVVDVLFPLLHPALDVLSIFRKYLLAGGLALLMCWLAAQSFVLTDSLIVDQQWRLPAAQFEEIKHMAAFIPKDAQVLVIANDAVLEWSPYLLQREVINTKFGLEWQPAELEKVTLLNEKIRFVQSWDDVLRAVSEMNGQSQIYVVSTNKRKLNAFNPGSHVLFTIKFETDDALVGLLSRP